jgi:hypothetical protein
VVEALRVPVERSAAANALPVCVPVEVAGSEVDAVSMLPVRVSDVPVDPETMAVAPGMPERLVEKKAPRALLL